MNRFWMSLLLAVLCCSCENSKKTLPAIDASVKAKLRARYMSVSCESTGIGRGKNVQPLRTLATDGEWNAIYTLKQDISRLAESHAITRDDIVDILGEPTGRSSESDLMFYDFVHDGKTCLGIIIIFHQDDTNTVKSVIELLPA